MFGDSRQDFSISQLWDLDTIGVRDPNISRNKDGRYVVPLPWIEGHPPLPTNEIAAHKRMGRRKPKKALQSPAEKDAQAKTSQIPPGASSASPNSETDNQKVIKLQTTSTSLSKSPEESMKNEIEGVEKEVSVKTARATDVKPALAKARMLKEACSAPSIIDIEYEGKKGAVNAIKERKETEAAVKCNKVKDSETAVDSYVDGDKGDEVKESEGQKAGDEGDGVKDSEAKPKGESEMIVKEISIPGLELLACLIGGRLFSTVKPIQWRFNPPFAAWWGAGDLSKSLYSYAQVRSASVSMELPLVNVPTCELRSVIRFFTTKNETAVNIHRNLVSVYGEGCMSIQMVRRWRSWFLEGRQNMYDDERSDRPVTATDNAAMAAVRNVVEANRRVTIDEIMIRLPPGIEIGCSSIGTIMRRRTTGYEDRTRLGTTVVSKNRYNGTKNVWTEMDEMKILKFACLLLVLHIIICFKRPECLIQEFVKRKLRMYRKSNAGFGYDGIPILLLNISSGYCIQVICLLLMISGIEPNPGPKKQTTLLTEPTPTVKESADTELKTMIVQMSSEIRNLGERIDTRLSNIEKRMIEWDQRLLGVEMKLTTCVETLGATNEIVSENVTKLREIVARTDFLEMKLREPNLVFYGVEGEANEGPAERLQKVKSIIKEKMQILESINITKCHRLGKANKSPILISLPEYEDRIKLFKNTTKLRDSKIYINKDYSKKIRDQRLILIAKRKELFEKGTRSKLRDNKLIVNEEYYIIQSPAMKTELKGRGWGGILIGIKKNFQHTVRKIETNPYWISVLTHKFLDKTTESICLLFVYLPPNALQEQNLTNLLRHIEYHMSEGNEVLIAGDINIRIGNAGGFHNPLKLNSSLNKYRKSKDLISSKLSEKLISFTDSNSITIANGRTKGDTYGSFTFISERGSSVLDYFMYTHGLTQIISDMWIEELSYSDHLPIVLQINTGYEAIKSSHNNEILTRKFIWTKENVEMLKHNLSDIEDGNETDINTKTVNFTKQIYTAMESANIIKFAKR
ncbi:hypothetical protein LAZ67_4004274 [Cordylochernes scorpioides]|uniref:Mos1 transposase HTH domain-containing protein n=1 Tax=Cordylochernes scorpioides TaxID=51811 RepID=A0ABY6KJ20_9ARAC|nr:hypothetical protein LAZ67_4004274 [Cordylochernes scorpioides]